MTRVEGHALVFTPSPLFKDGASRCECGWVSKTTTPSRAAAAHTLHANAQTPEWKNRPKFSRI